MPTFVDLFEAARKIVCIPGDESELHDSSLSRPTVRTGSRGPDPWVVTASRSTYGDGRHNRGLIVVIIHSCSAARGRRSLCAPVLWQNAVVLQKLTERKEWKFFGVLPKATPASPSLGGRSSC